MDTQVQATVDAIRALPRSRFRARFVRGFALSEAFSTLVCLGASALSEAEREQLWLELGREDIPLPEQAVRQQPEALEAVAKAVTGRMVELL